MNKITRLILVCGLVLLLSTLACRLLTPSTPALPIEQPPSGDNPPPPDQPATEPGFGPIVFSEYVTDDGELLNSSTVFPAGTQSVYFYFEYWGMEPGQPWGYYLTKDGHEYEDSTGESWEDYDEGWVAYILEENTGLSGEINLTLYIGDESVQTASFVIETVSQTSVSGSGAFGSIQYAEEITDEGAPVNPSSKFDFDTTQVYAIFSFFNMTNGGDWTREWLINGEVDVSRDLIWDEGADGITWTYLHTGEGKVLSPGTYRLNLYIDGQLASSADFEIGEPEEPEAPQGPATPEEIVDSNLMPAYEILLYSPNELLRDLADFALRHRITIELSSDISGDTHAMYSYACEVNGERVPGDVFVSTSWYNETEWVEIAAGIGHELRHAVQHVTGQKCGCTVEKEYYAFLVNLYVLQESGRMDLLEEKWRNKAYSEDGSFNRDKLWAGIKDAYSSPSCPDY